MQEILLLVVIALALFYLPRLRAKKAPVEPAVRRRALTGPMRLSIAVSLVWVAAAAVLLEPWAGAFLPFLCFGPGPVALFWAGAWVWHGYRRP
jgi:hypothetical protein